jgi:hypothetical protein
MAKATTAIKATTPILMNLPASGGGALLLPSFAELYKLTNLYLPSINSLAMKFA